LKALVTGASGFIGSHVAERLLSEGFEVRCLMRKSSNNKWLDIKKYDMEVADFDDKEGLKKALKNIDYVFHVAGLNFAKNKDDYQKTNTIGTRNLIEAVYENQVKLKRFVYVSSLTATGPSLTLDNPVNEESPRNPVTAYGLSKKLAEDEIYLFKEKVPFTIIKPPAVIGPRDTAIFSIFKIMYYGLAAHIGLDKKYISMIHATDLANGIVEAAISENTIDQSYMLTNDDFHNWDYISDVFKTQMNKSFYLKFKIPDPVVMVLGRFNEFIYNLFGKHPIFDSDKAIDITRNYWTCSADKAKRDFGFKQTISFEDGVRNTYQWYKEHKWL
jgi:dihydroflavonol-4-reductase